MELLHLVYFCDAAKTQNFSKTAAKFFVPPSNISQIIKRLEAEIGTSLFIRNSNRVTLSEAGKRFYSQVSTALSIIEEAKNEAANASAISGDIKMRVLANRRLVIYAVDAFMHKYPNVNFIIRHDDDEEFDCDILISHNDAADFFEHHQLLEDEIVLAIHDRLPIAHKKVITGEDLKNEHFISMHEGKALHSITLDICNRFDFVPLISVQTDDPDYIRKYVELGLGIAFIPKNSWNGLFSENIIFKRVLKYNLRTSIYLPKNRKTKPAVYEFIRLLDGMADNLLKKN